MRVVGLLLYLFFFFKQKTAYEMRISDWSSDVCSSDLSIPVIFNMESHVADEAHRENENRRRLRQLRPAITSQTGAAATRGRNKASMTPAANEIGRASCRERVCQYV